jgi:hypothetical protein
MNGTAASSRGKRKADFSPLNPPPTKRAVNGKLSPGDNTPDIVEAVEYDDEPVLGDDMHATAAMFVGTPGSLGEWQGTIQKVVRNVVAIRFCQTCSFDTDQALTSEATGFVVDSKRGYVVIKRWHCRKPSNWFPYTNHEDTDIF